MANHTEQLSPKCPKCVTIVMCQKFDYSPGPNSMTMLAVPNGKYSCMRCGYETEKPEQLSPAREQEICTGFQVKILCHTPDALSKITSPEALRFQIGHMLDGLGICEEVDYTLDVGRTYGN